MEALPESFGREFTIGLIMTSIIPEPTEVTIIEMRIPM